MKNWIIPVVISTAHAADTYTIQQPTVERVAETYGFNTVADYYFAALDTKPLINELYATIELVAEKERGLIYLVAAQYWQDGMKESQCQDECQWKSNHTTIYTTEHNIPSEVTEALNDFSIKDIGTFVREEIEHDPLGYMQYMFLGTAIALRHVPNGVYSHGCRTIEEEFVEGIDALAYALTQMKDRGFAYNYDLLHDE